MTLIPYPGPETTAALNRWTAPVWEAAGRGELVVPQCEQCDRFRMQPSPFCPNCQSQAVRWPVLSGRGRLYSYSMLRHPSIAGAAYAPAVVELEDAPGIRLISNIIDAEPDDLAIDLPLEAHFHPIANGLGLTVFRPRR